MSEGFALATALNPEDIPRILKTTAFLYKTSQMRDWYPWHVAADELSRFADDLAIKIEEAKLISPKPPTKRVKLNF